MNRSILYNLSQLVLVIFIGILLIVIASQSGVRFDFSRNNLFSFQPSTIDLAQTLVERADDQPVEFIVLADPGTQDRRIVAALGDLSRRFSNLSVTVQPRDLDPLLLQEIRQRYSIPTIANNSLVLRVGSNVRYAGPDTLFEFVASPGAQPQLTGFNLEYALVILMESLIDPRIFQIGILQGQGEFSHEQLQIEQMLNRELFRIRVVQPQRDGAIPEDLDLLVVSLPGRDYPEGVLDILLQYVQNGGRVLLMYDGTPGELPRFSEFVRSVGFTYNPVLVVEQNREALLTQFQEAPFIFIPRVNEHPVTQSIKEQEFVVILAGASPVLARETYGVVPLLYSSGQSGSVRPNGQTLEPSPEQGFLLAAGIEINGIRHIAFGSSGLLQHLPGVGQVKGNVELFARSVQWIVGQETTGNIQSRSIFRLPVRLSPSTAVGLTIVFSFLLPLLFISTGMVVWFIRKRR